MTNQTFTLFRTLLPLKKNSPFENKEGRLTYMGQILKQCKLPTMGKENSPAYCISDLTGCHAHQPFSIQCSIKVVGTDLSTYIINTPPENEWRLTKLLNDSGLAVTFEN